MLWSLAACACDAYLNYNVGEGDTRPYFLCLSAFRVINALCKLLVSLSLTLVCWSQDCFYRVIQSIVASRPAQHCQIWIWMKIEFGRATRRCFQRNLLQTIAWRLWTSRIKIYFLDFNVECFLIISVPLDINMILFHPKITSKTSRIIISRNLQIGFLTPRAVSLIILPIEKLLESLASTSLARNNDAKWCACFTSARAIYFWHQFDFLQSRARAGWSGEARRKRI